MAKNYAALANDVVSALGGKENIVAFKVDILVALNDFFHLLNCTAFVVTLNGYLRGNHFLFAVDTEFGIVVIAFYY